MWESRRDFQRVWEGWEAGFMAFHAFHTLPFPWPAVRPGDAGFRGGHQTGRNTPYSPGYVRRDRLSMSALAILHQLRWR